jgi:hypothetical protein
MNEDCWAAYAGPMRRRETEQRLGIDIGRVLMCPVGEDGRPDTSFLDGDERSALEIPASPHVYEVVPSLVDRFERRVWLVSKAGPRSERLTRRWLGHHRFHERTGLRPDRVRFCLEREDKRAHALELGLTHFIDDRVDVLCHLRGVVSHLLLFGVQTGEIPDWVTHVLDWRAVAAWFSGGQEDELGGHALGQPDAVGRQ